VLKITTTQETDQSLKVHLSGQFTREYIVELEQILFTGRSPGQPGQNVALDLENVTFVDRDSMGFLCSARSRNVSVENIPSYVIRWIEQERICGASDPEKENSD
jgi:anti-anti-sigma regulatory factor